MDRGTELAVLLGNTRLNAAIGWLLLAILALVGVESALDGDWVWVIVSFSVVGLGILPSLVFSDHFVMLPWEVLALGIVPLVTRGLFAGLVADIAAYLAVAAVALVIAVELEVFTPVRMTTWFAVFFVVVTTMATAGIWAVLRWLSDVFLGTTLVYSSPPPVDPAIEEVALKALMWDFVAATVGGVLAGVIFALYFRRLAAGRTRLPPAVAEAIE
ncbi:hypothetical protein [Halodesulfurarchaeum sp.]|uniref:hypothetical protein n=1 Tax=Halodesulfurarchaeum sp. TaxID=1980530 RepID=UPI001BC1966E|nr:hypothetical protein [Halodesulfurarchaeum sp.]